MSTRPTTSGKTRLTDCVDASQGPLTYGRGGYASSRAWAAVNRREVAMGRYAMGTRSAAAQFA